MKTAKPTASASTTPRCSQRTPVPDDMLTTTARSTMPRMSSKTAAPRMICAARLFSTCRSCNTRAVMPTLVATMAAATNTGFVRGLVPEFHVEKPAQNGRTIAGDCDVKRAPSQPDQVCGLVSRPTVNSRKMAPISASEMMLSLGSMIAGCVGTQHDAGQDFTQHGGQ